MLTHYLNLNDSSGTSTTVRRSLLVQRNLNPPHQLNRVQRVAVWILSAFLVLGIGWVGYKALRIGLYAWSAYQSGTAILTTVSNSADSADLVTLQPQIKTLAASVEGVQQQMRPFAPLLQSLRGWTPYGATLAAMPDLLIAGSELTGLAADAISVVGPAITRDDGIQLDTLTELVSTNPGLFAGMAERAQRANTALLAIPADQIHPALGERLAQAQSLSPLMAPSLQAAQAFPDLLGMRKPVTYLVLFQNNHEFRGTGGFISAVGALTISRGQLVALETENAYDIFSEDVEYPQASSAMQKYLKSEILVFRDANWSPDLPTSGRTARQLYEQVRDAEIDGIVTVDLNAVEMIIDALDGIQIEGVDETITGANVVDIIKELWANPLSTEATTDTNWREWYDSRKDFVPVLAGAILNRLKTRDFSFMRLVSAGTEALNQRSIQIWLDNPQATAQLAALGWDGSLHSVAGADYLALVDTNVGFNKVNAVVTREVSYTVTWPDGAEGRALAKAKITYVHPVASPGHVCDDTPRYGDTYDDMIARCYFNYIRLYVPRNSTLVSVEGVEEDSISSQRGEARTQVLSGFFVMKPGSVHTVTFTYKLPATIQEDSYSLIAQRQSGSGPLPIRWQIGDSSPQQEVIEGNWVEWQKSE